jgi:hypothetical protein
MTLMKALIKEALTSILGAIGAAVLVMYYLDIWPKKNLAEFVKYALFIIIIVGGGAIIRHLRRRQIDYILGRDSDDEKPGG